VIDHATKLKKRKKSKTIISDILQVTNRFA